MSDASIQYLGGLEPESTRRIQQAVERFKVETRFKEENSIFVDEIDRHRKGDVHKKPLAHRYRIRIYLGDSGLELPRNHGKYLSEEEVIAGLEDLASIWIFLRDYRVKKAIDHKKRIAQLNKAAAVSEEELKKW